MGKYSYLTPSPFSVLLLWSVFLFYYFVHLLSIFLFKLFLGGALYPETPSNVRRALLGGLTFIAIKGVLKVYHKQHQYIRQSRRVIDNFDPNNTTQLSVNSE